MHRNFLRSSLPGLAFILVCCLVLRSNSAASSAPTLSQQLIGTWRVVTAGDILADGTFRPFVEYGPHPLGYLMYDNTNHMCVSFSNPNHPQWANAEKPTVQERATSYDAVYVYCGTYEVIESESRIIHRPELSSWPHFVGTDQSRIVHVQGDQLTLSGRETAPNSTMERYEIVWQRVHPASK